jgi:hypothetical protein
MKDERTFDFDFNQLALNNHLTSTTLNQFIFLGFIGDIFSRSYGRVGGHDLTIEIESSV